MLFGNADIKESVLEFVGKLRKTRADSHCGCYAANRIVAFSKVAKAFSETLTKLGVEEIECKTFDPNFHNAVMHIEDEQYGEGEIVEVFQKGFKRGDKVLRYAMVKTAN